MTILAPEKSQKLLNSSKLKLLNTPEQSFNAIKAILPRPIAKIIKFIKELGRGRTPWLHAEDVNGKRFATFISPKAFQGYWWNEDCSVTVNLETGAKYQVSEVRCDCKDWYHRVRTNQKERCKHQDMRLDRIGRSLSDRLPDANITSSVDRETSAAQSYLPAKNDALIEPAPKHPTTAAFEKLDKPKPYNPANRYKINPDILDPGLSLKRSDDHTCTEWYFYAWHKTNPFSEPVQKKIGRIIETDTGFMAAGVQGNAREIVSYQADAVGWILRYNGFSYAAILEAYKESKLPRIKPKAEVTSSEAKSAAKKYPKILRSTPPDVVEANGGFF